jgi:sigma-B regulation protein RsbU (phosphoserine phosphatase)
VIGVDHILSQTNDFLRSLAVSPSGQVFILERNGLLVGSSSSEKAYVKVGSNLSSIECAG